VVGYRPVVFSACVSGRFEASGKFKAGRYPMSNRRRWLPPAIAVVVLAGVAIALLLAYRSPDVPSKPPKTAPAVGSCWNVTDGSISGQLPFVGAPVACTAPHTAEIAAVAQVDRKLVQAARTAKGQDSAIDTVAMTVVARAGCTRAVTGYLGGSFRASQLTVHPDFIAPARDGFYACVVAQVADPGGDRAVTRSASLAGALGSRATASQLAIDCVAGAGQTAALSFVSCGQSHIAEFVGLYTVTPAGAPFNGPKLKDLVPAGCRSLVDDFLGLAAGKTRSDLQVSYVGPDSAALWSGSDQTFACYAVGSPGWTGTIKGLGTRPLPH
jgi:putative regulator of septum formation